MNHLFEPILDPVDSGAAVYDQNERCVPLSVCLDASLCGAQAYHPDDRMAVSGLAVYVWYRDARPSGRGLYVDCMVLVSWNDWFPSVKALHLTCLGLL